MSPQTESGASRDIRELRSSIDSLDGAFMFILSERMRTVSRIMRLKKKYRVPPDKSAERDDDIKRTCRLAKKLGLSGSLISEILQRIYLESKISSHCDDFNGGAVPEDGGLRAGLKDFRTTLLSLDSAFCYLLAERFRLVMRIGEHKERNSIPAFSEDRWKEVLATRIERARMLGISTGLVSDILEMIHLEALTIEEGIIR